MKNITTNDYKKQIGVNLAKYRKAHKLSQSNLAKLTGISPQTISSIETGVNYPSIKMLVKFAQVINIPLAYFLTFDSNIYNTDDKELTFLAVEAFKELDYDKRKMAFRLIDCLKSEV